MTRKELDEKVREHKLQSRFLDKYGKSYSRCSKKEVEEIYNEFLKEKHLDTCCSNSSKNPKGQCKDYEKPRVKEVEITDPEKTCLM